MSAQTLPPPTPPLCLTRSYKSREQKGGTVIAEEVLDLEVHKQNLLDPDIYRRVIGRCWACSSTCLHALCFRDRVLYGSSSGEIQTVRMYRCSLKTCGAVFTVLPAVIARHLWRLWISAQGFPSGPKALTAMLLRGFPQGKYDLTVESARFLPILREGIELEEEVAASWICVQKGRVSLWAGCESCGLQNRGSRGLAPLIDFSPKDCHSCHAAGSKRI